MRSIWSSPAFSSGNHCRCRRSDDDQVPALRPRSNVYWTVVRSHNDTGTYWRFPSTEELLVVPLNEIRRTYANSIVSSYRRNLGRQANPTRPNAPPSRGNTSSPSAYSPSSQGPLPSPSQSSTTMAQNDQAHSSNQAPQISQSSKKNVPYFFREQCAGFVVKGNFMTLAAKPQLVEEGEWLAHQSRFAHLIHRDSRAS